MTGLTAPPFWVVGAPRSGTTFFGRVLDRHPGIFLTEESRVMTFMNRIYNRLAHDRWILAYGRDQMLRILEDEIPRIVERFYADLGAQPGQRWGDKHPHYADSYTDPECLDLIERLFPGSQFVHLVRDGRAVAASIDAKGWKTLDEGLTVWQRHVTHARTFGTRIGLDRYLEVRYEDLVASPAAVVTSVLDFLGLPMAPAVEQMLAEEARSPTAYSGPTTELAVLGRVEARQTYTTQEWTGVNRRIADLLVEFRYETAAWRRELLGIPGNAEAQAPPAPVRDAVSRA